MSRQFMIMPKQSKVPTPKLKLGQVWPNTITQRSQPNHSAILLLLHSIMVSQPNQFFIFRILDLFIFIRLEPFLENGNYDLD